MRRPAWLEPLDHTADAGFIVTAATLPVVFERAAHGLFHLIGDLNLVRDRDVESITLEAHDREALLVQWLSELNFRHQTGRKLFARFAVDALTESHLSARAWGEAIDPARHRLYTEVKAITFHGLKVERAGRGWQAQVIVDL